ncbi:polycystic kidney disease and receptor for egg jelly-related protein-like [Neovison vison]|uniref:polycystic kidney disease and receptor for egg jelly-related protein-like n=1 Tax=Neovison vison TaxID=452646 RepID=UPI001CF0C85D|nr:polycystic kidney disease and receptor for egg jelly-related protein-like [Neogale vison]
MKSFIQMVHLDLTAIPDSRATATPESGLRRPDPASIRRPPPAARTRGPALGDAAALRAWRAAPGLGEPAGSARVHLRPRAAPGGGVILAGGGRLCLPRGPARPLCVLLRVLLRARLAAAPALVHLRLSARRGRLSLLWRTALPRALGRPEWTFWLVPLRPAGPRRPRRSTSDLPAARPRPSAGFVAQTQCPTDGPTPVVLEALTSDGPQAIQSSVSCQVSPEVPCEITMVKINRNKDGEPLVLTRKMEATLNATYKYNCVYSTLIVSYWQVFSVNSVKDLPQWYRPLDIPITKSGRVPTFLHIPPKSLTWGVYVMRFVVDVYANRNRPQASASDFMYVSIVRSDLEAVIAGGPNITIKFTDQLVLDGSGSSDPDSDSPSQGLRFSWYCTTDPKNYQGHKITVMSNSVCTPKHTNLNWKEASGPVLTLQPGTLKGGDDPFPWMNDQESCSAEVVGFRMTGTTPDGDVVEIMPDVAEVYIARKNLSFASFNLTVGPESETEGADESLKRTTGKFRVEVDSSVVKELLVHIVTEVTVLFTVLVYAGSEISPTALVATFLVPHDIPPMTNQSDLFDSACAVREARVVCLPASLLQVIAQRGGSSECTLVIALQAPRFVMAANDKLVRIALFSAHCLDMYGIQSDWREDTCVLGERTTWRRVHCICQSTRRVRRQLDLIKQASRHLQTHFLTTNVIVVPNPVDLRLEVITSVTRNYVTLFTVLFIMLMYIILAFWSLLQDETDQYLRLHVIILLDNDPYDKVCYLVTVFTGSRYRAGTRADVFMQLMGTEGASDVHCLSHPHFTTLYRGGINTFLLTTKRDLGDIHSIRVWHNNEGKSPSWYLSRVKVENLFSRHIWLFLCREWLCIDTSLDRTFLVTDPDQPINRKDYFLIESAYRMGRDHLWFSIFSTIIDTPFNRLQRLSCCLAMLMASLLCNIMFFNLNRTEGMASGEGSYVRSMMIGLESVLIALPLQMLIIFLFTYSQREPRVTLETVSPRSDSLEQEHAHWQEFLKKWHVEESAHVPTKKASEPPTGKRSRAPKAAKALTTIGRRQKKGQRTVTRTQGQNKNASNANTNNNQVVASTEPSPQAGPVEPKEKSRVVLPPCCLYVAWCLVFVTSSISSFFIIFYGLSYSYEKSMDWLFASFCSFCLSVLLVQPCKIILLSGFRAGRRKYCKNLSWTSKYRYIEIELHGTMNREERKRRHQMIMELRRSRMYQPLTEDEILIFKRKKAIKRRAFLFLCYVLTHFIFLALLLSLVALLRHTDSFYYNQFVRDRFSVDLGSVTKLEDIYRWLNSVLVPLVHNDPNPAILPDSSSKVLGLPLLRQVRARPGDKLCLPANFAQTSMGREIHCHPSYGTDPEDTRSYSGLWNKVLKRPEDKNTDGFTYKPPEKIWGYVSHGLLHTYGSGGYAFYFFPEQQPFNSTVRLRELQSSEWLDEQTWAVILELTTFNPDVSLFCSISVVFEASQLGVVNTSLSVHSFSLADFDRETSAEIYLYVAILIFFLAYVVDEGYIIMQERASYVRSVYNLLNFALKCIFTVLIVLFFRKHFLATGIIRFYLSHPEDFIPFHAVSQVDHAMRIILGFLLFLTILKTLRYSRIFYDVRLAQRAIQAALPGICHMALVVSVYFFVYMAFGYLAFGQHEWNYSNLIHATQTIFSYCVSAFQSTEFSNNRVLGVLFLSSFMLVMICILINLFQAVILSAYEEMKQPVYEEPSDEAEAMTYLCRKLRAMFRFLTFQPRDEDEPEFFVNMLYGQPEKNSRRYLGLKTRNIKGKKMVYLVV